MMTNIVLMLRRLLTNISFTGSFLLEILNSIYDLFSLKYFQIAASLLLLLLLDHLDLVSLSHALGMLFLVSGGELLGVLFFFKYYNPLLIALDESERE